MLQFDRKALVFATILSAIMPVDRGFYVPGVAPVEFSEQDAIEVKCPSRFKAIKLTSVKTQLPYEYYSVGFCKPDTVRYYSENLGEVLRGDRIVNTPFKIQMKTEVPCSPVCKSKDDPLKLSADETNELMKRISEEYHVHLLIDNLPCATRIQLRDSADTLYENGYRLGYVTADGTVYVNNHLTFVLHYHEHEPQRYRVVRFEVQPRSVDYKALNKWQDDVCSDQELLAAPAQKLEKDTETKLLWTYSVRWEQSDVRWASRWDIYLAMTDVQIHWFSIINSIVVVLCLSGFLSVIMIRTIRRDIAQYNKDDDLDETLEETGWKLVHGDVFRPPQNPKLLTCFVGSGIQLFGMTLITIFFAMLGMLSPASRGSIATAALFLFCFMGLIAGYYAGRLYKTLRGVQWKRAAFQTCCLFPTLILGTGFVLNFFLIGKNSSGAVPFTTMLLLLFMWFGIDLPLVFFGFYFGFRKHAYQHPVRTNQIPRQVPEQPWYMNLIPCVSLAGILPFGAMFIELFFIFSALYENQFYYLFGFLFLVTIILMISCAQISIVVTYFQLCAENYHWWWRSFVVGGSCALYVYGYSVFYYFTKLEIVDFIPTLLYFAYTALIALSLFFLTATIGFFASYWFVCKIYGAVKID